MNIIPFNYHDKEVRTLTDNGGKPWFVANDVAKILGYQELKSAVRQHCKKVNKIKGCDSPFGVVDINLIPESDVYRLIMRSNLEGAEAFQDWVVEEVLPAIRKTGGYITAHADDTNEEIMARALLVAQETLSRRDERIKTLETENQTMQPKALFADAVSSSTSSILVGEMAKILKQNGIEKMGQNRFFAWLRENGYLIKRKGTDYNMPTQKSMELGLFEIKERTIVNPDDSTRITKTPKVSGKGQQYFVNIFLGGQTDAPEESAA